MSNQLHKIAKDNVSFGGSNNRTPCPGYLSPIEKSSSMGLIIIHEWWGMNSTTAETADSFGRAGFRALVPDL
jgi:dienelactone hydrolase